MLAPTYAAETVLTNPERIPELDGLRGIAILLVIFHMAAAIPEGSTGVIWLAALIAEIGWIGVQLFFVLSGFLITGNLLDDRNNPGRFRTFYARRILRIFPLYYTVLVIGLLILPQVYTLAPEFTNSLQHQIWLWTFLSNWAHPLGYQVYGLQHFWSLAVEEQFYLLWPLLVFLLPLRPFVYACIVLVLASCAARLYMLDTGATSLMVYCFTISRMDALIIGALAAVVTRSGTAMAQITRIHSYLVPGAICIFVLGACITSIYERTGFATQTIGYPLLAISFALVIVSFCAARSHTNHWLRTLLGFSPIRSIGQYSYAMYVLHVPIMLFLPSSRIMELLLTGSLGLIAYAFIIISISYVAALVSFHLLEKHFLRLKRHFPQAISRAGRLTDRTSHTADSLLKLPQEN